MNTNLYSKHAEEFSKTRVKPWDGWAQFMGKNLGSVLDIGCGNGRFLKFLIDYKIEFKDYIGIDSSGELLEISRKRYSKIQNAKFEMIDIEDDTLNNFSHPFDTIVLFGVMHHLRKFKIRREIFKNLYNILNKNGLISVTFWNFSNRIRDGKNFKNLGDNDFIITFGNNGAERFAHFYNHDEIKEIIKFIQSIGFNIENTFESDSKNLYVNLRK